MVSRKLLNLTSFFAIGLTLSGISVRSETVIPSYAAEWESELQRLTSSRGMRVVSGVSLAELLSNNVIFEDFENTCTNVLQSAIEENSEIGNDFIKIDIDSALELCAVINPWNSLECSGVLGVVASLATEIQAFVHNKNKKKGDLRAACLIASSVAPGRPFDILKKGSIKSKCLNVCSQSLSASISKIDESFCSMSSDLCNSIDFTLDPAFSRFTPSEFGIASSVSVLLSEGALGLKTDYKEGCNFVLMLMDKGVLSASSGSISESLVFSELTSFYYSRLREIGMLSDSASDEGILSSDKTLLSVIASQIADAIKLILGGSDPATPTKAFLKSRIRPKKLKKPVVATISSETSSEVSPLSESSIESSLSDLSDSFDSHVYASDSIRLSPVQLDWYNTIYHIIRKSTKEIDQEFDSALTLAVSKFDGANVFLSCVSVLRRSGLASKNKISAACRKIDPFSDVRCQKLNHFELLFLMKLREELETLSKRTSVVDLRDLCVLAGKMSLKSFVRDNDEEIDRKCSKALENKGFRSKYSISDKTIRKACAASDYIRSSACSDIVVSPFAARIQSVSAISASLYPKKNDRDRLKMVRKSALEFPTYADICNFVYTMGAESVEECSFGLREVLSKYTQTINLMDIEGACFVAFGKVGIYGPSPMPGVVPSGAPFPPSPVPGVYPPISGIYPRFGPYGAPPPPPPPGPYMGPPIPGQEGYIYSGGHVRVQYSESRRGNYKDGEGRSHYHDGLRFLVGGRWMVKLGDKWYIDYGSSRDLVDVPHGDPKYAQPPITDPGKLGVITSGIRAFYGEYQSGDPRTKFFHRVPTMSHFGGPPGYYPHPGAGILPSFYLEKVDDEGDKVIKSTKL
ncbi:hypothetical protein FG386_003462 [Cryptosporidium ryanae]|uniref:uncharacterized protein n=1 Tax=Cryptosporidium ryanae TaxID=515981 RepID=UPI00351A1031|nr:hypothetical protein FG386_003462 [Cryptosporidium ryanae]